MGDCPQRSIQMADSYQPPQLSRHSPTLNRGFLSFGTFCCDLMPPAHRTATPLEIGAHRRISRPRPAHLSPHFSALMPKNSWRPSGTRPQWLPGEGIEATEERTLRKLRSSCHEPPCCAPQYEAIPVDALSLPRRFVRSVLLDVPDRHQCVGIVLPQGTPFRRPRPVRVMNPARQC
jgi:hypothetical protein